MTLLGIEYGYLEVEPHAAQQRRSDREVILLLHGAGGNKHEWTFPAWRGLNIDHQHDPADRHSNGNLTPPLLPLPQFSLSDDRAVRCWRSILLALGHTIVNYTQEEPDEPIDIALTQFENRIVPFIRDEVLTGNLAGKRVVVLAHSRGGILARYYLANHPQDGSAWIRSVITLSSPHSGSDAPNAARRIRDELFLLAVPLFAADPVVLLLALLARLGIDVEPTDAQAQLVPGDPLFALLSQPADTPNIEFHTFAGSSVRVSRLYIWNWWPGSWVPRWDFPNPIPHFDWTLFPTEIDPISPMLDRVPDAAVFAEQREGQGDLCVTVDSARLPGVPHRSLPINHGEALFDETLFAEVADLLGTPLGNTFAEECTTGWIGNVRTRELHDPSRKTAQCQLDEIIHRWPFSLPDDAFDAGYDGCAYCMPQDHHPER
jgi:pimeloyl-ACP methyl ester carboxylesterase